MRTKTSEGHVRSTDQLFDRILFFFNDLHSGVCRGLARRLNDAL